ncbi:hypothetical protein [Sulfuricurvum sp.]|uniref:hypothetical protein n=1 Tax=Sulfuricurvum sp. TaxID=2025608 RepID=UPI002D79EF7B|nr:hypothetical protein [Sulfuricurvum sp.]
MNLFTSHLILMADLFGQSPNSLIPVTTSGSSKLQTILIQRILSAYTGNGDTTSSKTLATA